MTWRRPAIRVSPERGDDPAQVAEDHHDMRAVEARG